MPASAPRTSSLAASAPPAAAISSSATARKAPPPAASCPSSASAPETARIRPFTVLSISGIPFFLARSYFFAKFLPSFCLTVKVVSSSLLCRKSYVLERQPLPLFLFRDGPCLENQALLRVPLRENAQRDANFRTNYVSS